MSRLTKLGFILIFGVVLTAYGFWGLLDTLAPWITFVLFTGVFFFMIGDDLQVDDNWSEDGKE